MDRPRVENGSTIITADSARQGPKGGRVKYVLIGLILGTFVLVGAVLVINSQYIPSDPGQKSAADLVKGQEPSSSDSSHVPAGNPAYPVPAVPNANGGTGQKP